MIKILRVLFKFESEYAGPPLYIPGNSLRHALSLQINTSVGIFTTFSRLISPSTYSDFFYIRQKRCFLLPFFELWWDKIQQKRSYRCFFLPEFVTFDILDPPENLLELIKAKDLIQFGRNRNAGFGIVTLQDYLEIDLDALEFPTKASHLTLLSPALHLPPFVELYVCRHKQVQLRNHNKVNFVDAIAPGQFFRIKPGKDVPTIAKRGILRKGPLGHFGFGEFIVHDWKNN